MKLATIGFVLGVLVAGGVCALLNSVNEQTRKMHLLSDVHAPIRQCLDDIVQTYDRSDSVLAERKIRVLRQRWREYLEGVGKPPELFSNEIFELRSPTTRPFGRNNPPTGVHTS